MALLAGRYSHLSLTRSHVLIIGKSSECHVPINIRIALKKLGQWIKSVDKKADNLKNMTDNQKKDGKAFENYNVEIHETYRKSEIHAS